MKYLSTLMLMILKFSSAEKPPNIVFILSDDLGFNDVGFNGKDHHSDVRTPYIDKLAKEGLELTNYYVQPVCTPTRGQFLSGVHQIRTGLQNGVIWPIQRRALPLDFKLLPEQLRDCGYDTHMVGKWHLGFYREEFLPHHRGFNSYFGMLASSQNYFTHNRCWRGYCGYDMYSSVEGRPVNNTYGEYSTHLLTRKSIEALENRDKDKPFFLYLSHQAVHIPLQVPDEYSNRFSHIKNKKRRRYAGMVYTLDESVRNVTEYLRSQGLLNNTLIIFSTDNGGINKGGGNNWPLRGEKRTLYEGGIRSVGFIYGKPLGVSGKKYSGLLDVSDWFPTFLSVGKCAVVNGTQKLDGVDQWNSLRRLSEPPRQEILHFLGNGKPAGSRSVVHGFNTKVKAAIRVGMWKLITGNPGPDHWAMPPEYEGPGPTYFPGTRRGRQLQLFNIKDDRNEKDNLADENPIIVERLLRKLNEYSKFVVKYPKGMFDPAGDPRRNGGYWQPWVR